MSSTNLRNGWVDSTVLDPMIGLQVTADEKPSAEGNSAFFYGTLMHPAILRRVIANDGGHLQICPAVLFSHTRLHIQHCDYPAVVSADVGQKVMGNKALDPDEKTVRGVVARGLSAQDVALLDVFEGDEYRRKPVSVIQISSWSSLNDAKTSEILSKSSILPDPSSARKVPAFVYIWDNPIERLAPRIWSYDLFVKEKLGRWLAKDPTDEEQRDDEVNRRVSMAGTIVAPSGGEGTLKATELSRETTKPEFGHNTLKHFGFDKGYINLNNGSFGATPLPVTKYCDEITKLAEGRPDLFFRITFKPLLKDVRARVAKLLGAETDECVLVPNASHGINTVLRNFTWKEGDIFVSFSTTHYAIKQTLHYFRDTEPHPTVHDIPLIFPTTHAKILQTFRQYMKSLPDPHKQKNIVVVMDSVASTPGVKLPWEGMVKICKEFNAWSVVDAAQSIGSTQVNLSESQPDFWVTNCYKWLMAKRGCAVLYVPRRNQHLIRTSFPTSWGYVSPPEKPDFAFVFEWTGALDLAPYLSIKAALEFRESIGGEKAIQQYCNTLAPQGGKRMAEILGTETADPNEEYTGTMTNVRLPLPLNQDESPTAKAAELMVELNEEYNTFVAVFEHNGSLWVRASAQIWNELSDFEYTARALKAMCHKRLHATRKPAARL
ncbi:hypothetical protein FRB94_004204 [Tulasnella sp. JGI-2019a]|nr:hypothetical protein FRB94_004204 [Tulasnella sp. JGI-2019a]